MDKWARRMELLTAVDNFVMFGSCEVDVTIHAPLLASEGTLRTSKPQPTCQGFLLPRNMFQAPARASARES